MGSRYADKNNSPNYYGQNNYNSGNFNNSGKKGGRRKKRRRTFGDVISTLLMLIALCVFLFSAYTLYGFYKEYKKSADEYDNLESSFTIEIEDTDASDSTGSTDAAAGKKILKDIEALEDDEAMEELEQQIANEEIETEAAVENGQEVALPLMRNPIDFGSLLEVNEDIVGWLKISALDISYPIVQGEDNDFYLHRTFEKTENFAGCIFMNCDNRDDFTDQNTIIYGHNMKDGSMFGKLKQFKEEETFQKSKYFWIFAPDKIYQYRIFSAATVNKTGLYYQVMFKDEDFDTWINAAFENSVVENSDVEVAHDDRVVTLSTCTGDDATRFVVLGKLVRVYASFR